MSATRLELEQHLRHEEQQAQELRLAVAGSSPATAAPVRYVLAPPPEGPSVHDECANLLVAWWHKRVRGDVTMKEIKQLARRMRLRGRAK